MSLVRCEFHCGLVFRLSDKHSPSVANDRACLLIGYRVIEPHSKRLQACLFSCLHRYGLPPRKTSQGVNVFLCVLASDSPSFGWDILVSPRRRTAYPIVPSSFHPFPCLVFSLTQDPHGDEAQEWIFRRQTGLITVDPLCIMTGISGASLYMNAVV